jgi:Fe-S-cluster containining protein
MVKFPCTQCGACCKRAGETGLMPSKKDGSCIYLSDDNRCSIYSQRPDICSVYKMYKKYKTKKLLPKGTSERDYYKLTAKICNQFIEEDGLDDKYKIDIDFI